MPGADGAVFFRWDLSPESEDDDTVLPETGADTKLWTLLASMAGVAGGAALLTRRRRIRE